MKPKKNKPLKNLTTFRIGGPAKYFIEAKDLTELLEGLAFAREKKSALLVIGAGSNVLIADQGFPGLVIRLCGDFCATSFRGKTISAGAGICTGSLLKKAAQKSLSGLEFLTGIPGTVGGAVVMNAGDGREGIGDLISWVDVLDRTGKRHRLRQKDLKFGYRKSILQKRKYIVIQVGFKPLRHGRAKKIKMKMKELMKKRLENQPYNLPSAGSFFKNPKSKPAWKLIEEAGLKGVRVGGAEVSKKHANFIVNRGQAKAKDVLKLMKIIQKKVKGKLRTEVVIVAQP